MFCQKKKKVHEKGMDSKKIVKWQVTFWTNHGIPRSNSYSVNKLISFHWSLHNYQYFSMFYLLKTFQHTYCFHHLQPSLKCWYENFTWSFLNESSPKGFPNHLTSEFQVYIYCEYNNHTVYKFTQWHLITIWVIP